jgi:hypothetical protein
LSESVSGSLAFSVLYPGQTKGVVELKSTIANQLANSISLLQIPFIGNTSNIINSLSSFKAVSKMNEMLHSVLANINTSFADSVLIGIENRVFNTINMDPYQGNLDISKKFCVEFETRMLATTAATWFTSFKSSLSQNQINALVLALEVPNQDLVKIR